MRQRGDHAAPVSGSPTPGDAEAIGLHTLIDSLPDGLLVTDGDGVIVLANARLEELFGYERAELLGETVERLLPGRYAGPHRAHRLRYQAEPQTRQMGAGLVLWARHRDGREFPVEVSLSPVASADGVRTVATVRDVSAQRASDRERRRILGALDAVADGVLVMNGHTMRIQYANEGAARLLGYSVAALVDLTPSHLTPPGRCSVTDGLPDRATVQCVPAGSERRAPSGFEPQASAVIEPPASAVFETVQRRSDGTDIPVEVVAQWVPLAGIDDAPACIAVLRDISDRKAAEAAERASSELFKAVFEDAPVAMAVVSLAARERRNIVRANQAFADLLGYERAELETMNFAELSHPDDLANDLALSQELASGHRPWVASEKRFRHRDGRYVRCLRHGALVTTAAGEPLSLAHILDISDRVEAEQERERRALFFDGLAAVTAALLAAAPMPDAYAEIARRARRLTNADSCIVTLLDPRDGTIRFAGSDGSLATQTTLRDAPFPGSFSACVLDAGGPLVFDREQHPPPRPLAHLHVAAVGVPVQLSEHARGALIVVRDDPSQVFSEADTSVLAGFAEQTAVLIELADARRAHEEVAVLEDRERIARDLHDHVIQQLFATGMQLEGTIARAADPAVQERLSLSVDAIDRAIGQLRSSIYTLNARRSARPRMRDQLLRVAADKAELLGFDPVVLIDGPVDDLPADLVAEVAAVVGEALTNTARHAHATEATVHLDSHGGTLDISVTDNGVGPNPAGPCGSGLGNLAERAAAWGGTSTLDAGADCGAVLRWTVPLDIS